MKEEKKGEKKEERRDMVILDEGVDMADGPGPEGVCCAGPLTPLRW